MKLLTFRAGAESRLGALWEDRVLDLVRVAEQGGQRVPGSLPALIESGEDGLARCRELLDSPEEVLRNASHPLPEVELLAPLDPPTGNVLCIGRNYREHAEESARALGEQVGRPTVFTKAQTSITGPYSDIPLHAELTGEVDWEVELGVVIGRRGVNIAREAALDHVFGYTVVNDLSARDVQHGWGGQFFKGKSLDGFCPIGPWVVTRDEIPDPQDLHLTLRVNGEVKQDASTRDMIFPVDELIAQLSLGMTLLPGTLIATGTPSGVGFAREPAEFLHPGDLMESEVEGIGTLRNHLL